MVTSQKFLSEQDHYDQSITYSGLPVETQVVAKQRLLILHLPNFGMAQKTEIPTERPEPKLLTERFSRVLCVSVVKKRLFANASNLPFCIVIEDSAHLCHNEQSR
jgi:hypothetical protein